MTRVHAQGEPRSEIAPRHTRAPAAARGGLWSGRGRVPLRPDFPRGGLRRPGFAHFFDPVPPSTNVLTR